MPFEDVHGNGGLLTTVGDLLTWNHNFARHIVGDADFVREMETPGRFSDGRPHGYALGLMVGPRYGLREVAHSGSTAGYTAHLTRFPDQQLSVAVLCNASSGGATQAANAVAALYLGDLATARRPQTAFAGAAADVSGLYRSVLTGEAVTITQSDNGIRIERGPQFMRASQSRYVAENGDTLDFTATGARLTDRHGSIEDFEKTTAVRPASEELTSLTGTYVNDEAELTLVAAVQDGRLVLKRRPDTTISLTPLYRDAFRGSIGTVIFHRNKPMQLSIVQDRVWDLRFTRRDQSVTTAQ
jgi:hypothetical protein